MSVRIVDPVVVYPETLSNQAFTSVNSPPHSTYGSIPNMNESIHERTMVRKPSFRVIAEAFFTKMKGNAPTRRVMTKLMSNGVNAESMPYIMDTTRDMNMNSALTSSASPTFRDIDLMFIRYCLSFSALTLFFSSWFSSIRSVMPALMFASWSSPSKVYVYLRPEALYASRPSDILYKGLT